MKFQKMIQTLSDFWSEDKDTKNCVVVPSSILQVGAATLCDLTSFNILTEKEINFLQLQYCLRPSDSRVLNEGNRVGSFYQMQVILKPSPDNIQELCLKSIEKLGLNRNENDIRFIEDNWKNPSIGASGIGYEIWCNGMEVCQFTYMQKIGGIDLNDALIVELAYGMERLALYLQKKDNIFDLEWNDKYKYKDFHSVKKETEFHYYNQLHQEDNEKLKNDFRLYLETAKKFLAQKNLYLSYYEVLKASHILNILDARNLIGKDQRQKMIFEIKDNASAALQALKNSKN